MGFGRDLRNSHEGLLKLQDWELKVSFSIRLGYNASVMLLQTVGLNFFSDMSFYHRAMLDKTDLFLIIYV